MFTNRINDIIQKISEANPLHAKKIKKNLSRGIIDLDEAEDFFDTLSEYLESTGRDINYCVSCYLLLIKDMFYYRQKFLETGCYANTSSHQVQKKIYENTEIMEYHMHGLLLAQFLWPDQFHRFTFFKQQLLSLHTPIESYLEIGAGHGLYVKAALNCLPQLKKVDVLDISATSLDMCRYFTSSPIVNYHLKNAFDLEENKAYDFISIAEVLEHLEDPAAMLFKIRKLLKQHGTIFLSTPVNSPMIDHIYLFRSITEIKELITSQGLCIVCDTYMSSEDLPYDESLAKKVPIMYAAFLRAC